MELPVAAQALQAAYSVLAGALLGLVYDVFRALRRAAVRRWAHSALDALFCLAAGFFLFFFALAWGDGRLRGFMLCCLAAGWGVYLLTFSRHVSAILETIVKKLGKVLSKAAFQLSIIRKIKKIVKSIFSKVRFGFKMRKYKGAQRRAGKHEGSTSREARKGRYDYPSGRGRPVSVRPGRHRRREGGDREIQPDKGGAQHPGSGVGGGQRRA